MKCLYLICIMICICILSGCSKEEMHAWVNKEELTLSPYMDSEKITDVIGKMEYDSFTPDVKGFAIQVENQSKDYITMAPSTYLLEVKVDGKWYQVPRLREYIDLLLNIRIDSNEQRNVLGNLQEYVDLVPGEYRVVCPIAYLENYKESYYFTVEFEMKDKPVKMKDNTNKNLMDNGDSFTVSKWSLNQENKKIKAKTKYKRYATDISILEFVIKNGTSMNIDLSQVKSDESYLKEKGREQQGYSMEILIDQVWYQYPITVKVNGDSISQGEEGKMQLVILWETELPTGQYRIICPLGEASLEYFALYLELI